MSQRWFGWPAGRYVWLLRVVGGAAAVIQTVVLVRALLHERFWAATGALILLTICVLVAACPRFDSDSDVWDDVEDTDRAT